MRSDWAEVELDLVCEKAQKVKRKEMPLTDTFLYLDIGGLNNQINRITSHKIYTWEQAPSRAQQLIKVGDVLFSTVRTYLKNIAPVTDKKYEGQICSSGFTVIRGKGKLLESRYALYLSLYEDFLHPLNELQTGTSYPAVRDSDVFAQVIPLAPFPEQRAIAAKIDQLFSRLDYSIASFKAAQEKLAVYRQAVLKQAFEGTLTLCSIESVTLGEELLISSGHTPRGLKNVSNAGDFQFYKVSDMNLDGNEVEMKFSNLKLTESEINVLKVKKFPKGTVIFPKRGGAILTNKKRILSQDSSIDLNLMGIVPNNQYISKYVYYFFLGLDLAKICDGSAVPQINNKNIYPLNFPKCNLQQQARIIKEIESRFSVCDHLQQEIERGLQKAEALRQSVLKKAFEGRLLTEVELADCRAMPDWEPAQQLLARIQSESQLSQKRR